MNDLFVETLHAYVRTAIWGKVACSQRKQTPLQHTNVDS